MIVISKVAFVTFVIWKEKKGTLFKCLVILALER